eukprot:jgi/Chrzof1/10968/Cz05g19010.t1
MCAEIDKLAKQAVYFLHKGDHDKADQQLKTAEGIAQELLPAIQERPVLRDKSFSFAMQEYAAAMVLKTYMKEDRLIRSTELPMLEAEE